MLFRLQKIQKRQLETTFATFKIMAKAAQPLCDELQKVAIDELNEVPERMPEDVEALRAWIKQQPHLNARMDERFLVQFLRGCKYSLEKAKDKIDNFHAFKTKYPDMFTVTNVDNVKFRQTFNLGSIVPLPTPLNENGPRIIIYRFNYPTNIYRVEDILQVLSGLCEIAMDNDPYASIQGVVYVVDLGTASASHYLQYTPNLTKRVLTFYEKTFPLRIKKVVYLNASPAAEQFFKMLFPLFSDKLRQRIFICGKDLSDINKCMPQKYMPTEYGGSNGTLDKIVKDYNGVWDDYREYFKKNADYGTDERLRSGKPIDFECGFGAGGSFRKIAVD